ncbi:MAG: OmpH family outer membrane protein [Alistipes sp.]|nr:OmpH family outer membrane protein [Alistipes sp.]
MKRGFFCAFAALSMLASCNTNTEGEQPATEAQGEATEVRTVECVASGDVVYVDLDYIMASSKLFASEGRALEEKVQTFQQKMVTMQEGWAKKEQGLAAEYNKLQDDAAKLQEEYGKGLITTLNAQQKQEELQRKGESIQSRMTALQSSVQSESAALQTEEQQLAEEQMVVMNKFQDLTRRAFEQINADKRYKMVVNAVSVVDADPTLNISDIVLKVVDELYEADNK